MCKTWPFIVEENNNNQETGGVRIKSVKNYESDGTLLTEKRYHYNRDFLNGGTLSSGVLAYIPQYTESYSNKRIVYGPTLATVINSFDRYSTTSLYNVMAGRGNHITYSEVTVEEPDNGYTVYKYKNHDNGYGDQEPLFWAANKLVDLYGTTPVKLWEADGGISMDLERGQLLSATVFDQNSTKKKETFFQYNDDPDRFDDHVRYFNVSSNSICLTTWKSQRITAGVIYTYFPYLKEKTEVSYFGADHIVQREIYTYDTKYRLNTSRKSYDSRDHEYITQYRYAVNHEESDPIVQQMMSKGMLAYPFQTIVQQSGSEDMEATVYSYRNDIGVAAIPQLYQKHRVYANYSDWLEGATSDLPDAFRTELLETTISRYDNYGNPNEVYERTIGNTAILWGYKGQYPVARIINASYSDVMSQIPGGQNTIDKITSDSVLSNEAITQLNALRAKLPQSQVFTYTYRPLVGPLTETDPKGFTVYYTYDSFGRLKQIYYIENGEVKIKELYEYNYQQL
jgi:YD repeat-containing protein